MAMIGNTDRITDILAAYDAQGLHRTGTDVDNASAEWMAREIRARGAEADLQSFALNRFDVLAGYVEIDGQRIDGVPMFDGGVTGPDGVTADLVDIDAEDGIGVIHQAGNVMADLYETRKKTALSGIIVVSYPTMPGIGLMNAEGFNNPEGPAVLQVPGASMGLIDAKVADGCQAKLVVDAERTDATAINVTCRIRGSDPSLPPLVVMTPRSGWWQCASERGGGIVLFLELLRAVQNAETVRDVIFTANSGHELSHLGLDHFLETEPELVSAAHCWIHLGANFAAAGDNQILLQSSNEEFRRLAINAMKEQAVSPAREIEPGIRPVGEARNVFDGQGQYLSLLGSNPLFHSPEDRWPQSVNVDLTMRLLAAWTAITLELAS